MIRVGGTKSQMTQALAEAQERLAAKDLALKAAQRDAAAARRRYQDLEGLWGEVAGNFRGFTRLRSPKVARGHMRTPAGHVTVHADWHLGSVVRPDSMCGAVAYSSESCHRAIVDITMRMLEDVEHERRTRPVDDALIVNLGDNIDGEIHPDRNWSRDLTAPEAAAYAGEIIGEVIDLYAQNFRTVTVLLVGGSNHERTTVKPIFDKGAELSLGYLIRKIAAASVARHSHVNVICPSDLEPVIEWRGRHWGAMHGHQITIRNRTPIPGMEDYYDGFQANRVALGLPPVEMLLMGHVHQETKCRNGRMRSFAPLCGSSQRAKSLYKSIDRGAQTAFLVGDRGPFAFTSYDRRPEASR